MRIPMLVASAAQAEISPMLRQLLFDLMQATHTFTEASGPR
jgi:hypothetical protein